MDKREPQDAKRALQELLELLSENPDLAERITITIKPGKLTQSGKPDKK